jgi:hypothetical protein
VTIRRPLHDLAALVQVDQVGRRHPVGLDFVFRSVVDVPEDGVGHSVREGRTVMDRSESGPDDNGFVIGQPHFVRCADRPVQDG